MSKVFTGRYENRNLLTSLRQLRRWFRRLKIVKRRLIKLYRFQIIKNRHFHFKIKLKRKNRRTKKKKQFFINKRFFHLDQKLYPVKLMVIRLPQFINKKTIKFKDMRNYKKSSVYNYKYQIANRFYNFRGGAILPRKLKKFVNY